MIGAERTRDVTRNSLYARVNTDPEPHPPEREDVELCCRATRRGAVGNLCLRGQGTRQDTLCDNYQKLMRRIREAK